jgi:hypothetical protein
MDTTRSAGHRGLRLAGVLAVPLVLSGAGGEAAAQPAPGQPAPSQPAPSQPATGQPPLGQPVPDQPAPGQPIQAQAPGSQPAAWDTASLPATRGIVRQYLLTGRGDVDGLVLADGTEVKLAPHLSAQVVYVIRPGDAVTVRGLRARSLPLVDAASITNDATGATVTDAGPPRRSGDEATISGTVSMPLHGKRGETNGALLDNGTIVRLPPHEAARWSTLLQKGRTMSVRGALSGGALGTVIEARAIGNGPDRLTELDAPPGPRGPAGAPPPPGPRG